MLPYICLLYTSSLPVATDLNSITNSIGKQLFITFSKFLQYIVPIIFIIGACVSSFKSKNRSKLLEEQSGIETIRDMSWQDFELLLSLIHIFSASHKYLISYY